MRHAATISIFLISLTICKAQSDYVVMQDQKIIDELISTYQILPESTTTTSLSTAELGVVKALLTKCIKDYNDQMKDGFKKRGEKKRHARMYQIMNLSNYKVQIVPYINEKGEKEVWINGFCDNFSANWRTEIVQVFDGGNCYFRVRLNISNNSCMTVGTNGYA